jgi:hypothetical protein
MPGLDTHPCPGGCGGHVSRARLSCKPCWLRLPADIRAEVTDAYDQRWRDPDGRIRHADALTAASRWYRANPRPPRSARR